MRMKLAMALASALVAAGTAAVVSSPAEATVNPTCEIAAHRGNTNVPQTTATENGPKAFQRAVALGVDWIEADVHATADDYPMIMHDADVSRTSNGTGTMRGQTAAQLRTYRLLDGSQIPYLSDLTAITAPSRTKLLIELKAAGGPLWWQRVADVLNAYPAKVVIQSKTASILDTAAHYMPNLERTYVYWKEIPLTTARKYGGIVIDKAAVTTSYLSQLDGVAVYPYLVSNESDWSKFAGKTDAMITNTPQRLMQYRDATPSCATPVPEPEPEPEPEPQPAKQVSLTLTLTWDETLAELKPGSTATLTVNGTTYEVQVTAVTR